MRVVHHEFPIHIGSVCDLDFRADGVPISVQGTTRGQVLMVGDNPQSLPEGWSNPEFPIVRCLHDGGIFLCDTGISKANLNNSWILDGHKIRAEFSIGAAAVDVVPLFGLIAVAYHPFSALAFGLTIEPIQRAGVAFFDLKGELVMGLNQEIGLMGLNVENVRCLSRFSPTQVALVPERVLMNGKDVENPLVTFDCATRTPALLSLPFPGTEATSISGKYIHLGSPTGYEDHIMSYDSETQAIFPRGEFIGIFRGLDDGGLIAQLSPSHYAVVFPGQPEDKQPIHAQF